VSNFGDKISQRVEYAQLHASYVRVFDTPDGQRVLRHLMKMGYMSKTTFVRDDPYETALNEGSRRLVLSLLKFYGRDHMKLLDQLEEMTKDES